MSREYGKVVPSFWNRGSGRKIRGDASTQIIALYLMTGPSVHMTGIYSISIPTMCYETGLGEEAVRRSLERLAELDFAAYDEENDLVWVKNGASYQIAESLTPGDKNIRGIVKYLSAWQDHAFVRDFYAHYEECFHLPTYKPLRSPSEGPSKPLGKPLRSQDQDQDQDQKDTHNAHAREGQPAAVTNHAPVLHRGNDAGANARPEPATPPPAGTSTVVSGPQAPSGPPEAHRARKNDPGANALPVHEQETKLLGWLQSHPSLARVASPEYAQAAFLSTLGNPKSDAALQSALGDLAGKALAAQARGVPLSLIELSEMLTSFCRKAWEPRSTPGKSWEKKPRPSPALPNFIPLPDSIYDDPEYQPRKKLGGDP